MCLQKSLLSRSVSSLVAEGWGYLYIKKITKSCCSDNWWLIFHLSEDGKLYKGTDLLCCVTSVSATCGCPIPGIVQDQVGWGLEQSGLVEGESLHMAGRWNEILKVPFNPNHSRLLWNEAHLVRTEKLYLRICLDLPGRVSVLAAGDWGQFLIIISHH